MDVRAHVYVDVCADVYVDMRCVCVCVNVCMHVSTVYMAGTCRQRVETYHVLTSRK